MLTPKQEQFCQEYLIDLNGAHSAARAGYSKSTSKVIAAQLMAKPEIKERIDDLMNHRAERMGIIQDKILAEFWSIANEDIKNFMSFKPNKVIVTDPETGQVTEKEVGVIVTFKDSDTIDTRNIAELSQGKDGQFRIKLYPRDVALMQVARHIGMYNDKTDHTTDGEKFTSSMQPVVIMPPKGYYDTLS